MKMKRPDKTARTGAIVAALLCAVVLLCGCSTTRRIADDDMLYTGRKIRLHAEPGSKLPEGLGSDISRAVAARPNNAVSLFGEYYRYPFPLGLWVYNNWSNPPSGLRHWLFNKLVEEPVLVSDIRPEVRVKMLDELLDNNGYFSGTATYSLKQGKNRKKATVIYDINLGPEYRLGSIDYPADTTLLNHFIDSLARRDPYLRAGSRYCTDSLDVARTRITNSLRNRGYYFFRPEFIEYLADSLNTPQVIDLRLTVASNLPKFVTDRYVTGSITTYVFRNQGGGDPDTIVTNRGVIVQYKPSRLRHGLIPECVTFRSGKVFSVRDMNRTQTYLSRLGIFNAISIDAVRDTLASVPTLDVVISCTFDKPIEASAEVNASSKSNSYLGPGLTLGITNRNLFGGGELLSVDLTGSYEWQTGRDSHGSIFNSYEVGLNASLAFPRLIAPRFIPRRRRNINWTRLSLGFDLLNRPHYFKMGQADAALSYDWQSSRHVNHSLTLFKLTYTKLVNTTAEFDSITALNPAVAQSFRNQFIPQIIYTYRYDRNFRNRNTVNVQVTLQEAGNIFWGIYTACGDTGGKRLLGTPFSQFVKGTAQVVYGHRMWGGHWIVSRVAVGAAHAYGNSTEVPYAEQFYCGGANSVRAFTVRSIGPGSYRPPEAVANSYFDQTGTFRFEANVEYRFPILGPLRGALFLDAGNVWLLKEDPSRPGGKLRASTFLNELALGTGAGLRFDISMLVVRADLGIGIHAPYDTGKSGYYNMPSFKNSLAFHLAIGYPF